MMPTSLRTLIDAALHATTVEDVHALCSRLCQELGFDYFIYGAQLPTSLIKPRFVIVSGYPQEWRQHYNDNGYIQIDPTVAHCIGHVTPLLWSDVTRRDNPFTAEARRFMHEAHDFGLRNGVSFPVHGVSGESAVLMSWTNENTLFTLDPNADGNGKLTERGSLRSWASEVRVVGDKAFASLQDRGVQVVSLKLSRSFGGKRLGETPPSRTGGWF